MRETFQGELKELNSEMCIMGGLCEDVIERAVRCFLTNDMELAKKVVSLGETISQKEREIETMCIQLIMKQQPVASDLRVISAALKMGNGYAPHRRPVPGHRGDRPDRPTDGCHPHEGL